MNDTIQEIFSDQIDDPQNPMRSEMDRTELFDLADNIKQNGLINPITVRPKGNRFEVVAGHRRFAACKIAGIIKIQCCVRELSDNEAFSVMAAENLERADVDPVDEAIFITRYMEQTNFGVSEIAKTLRRSIDYVNARIAVGQMPDYMKMHIKAGRLKLGVALNLWQIENERLRESWTELAVENGISVRQAEFQLLDYRTNKNLYDGIVLENPNNPLAVAPKPIMFRCAIDGAEYDVRLCKSVIISEENYPIFEAFVREFRALPAQS